MEFKRQFMYIAQKCLRPPVITGNRELVELFFRSLNTTFQDALNARLSVQGTLKVDNNRNSRLEDPYDLEQVVQRTVNSVSGKMIARVLKHTPVVMSRNNKINADSRGQVSFPKGETIRKAEFGPDIESLQQEINTLKTMYKVQETTRERHKKNMQGALDSIRTLIQTQEQSQKETRSPLMRFGQGLSQMGPPRPSRKCFYYFKPDYLFLFCLPVQDRGQKEGFNPGR